MVRRRGNQTELNLPVRARRKTRIERLMLAEPGSGTTAVVVGLRRCDLRVCTLARPFYHAINRLEWSRTAFTTETSTKVKTPANADWQSPILKSALGYKFLQVDEGYQYARGEYLATNATQFPDGISCALSVTVSRNKA